MIAAIFTETDENIGLGHLRRCEALAEHLRRAGITSHFFINRSPLEVENLSDFALCVVDSYLLPKVAYEYVSKKTRLAIFFDDTMRIEYPNGIILNSALDAKNLGYAPKDGHKLWLGGAYMLVRSEFLELSPKPINIDIRNVLITFGGTRTAQEEQEKLAKNLKLNFPHLTIKTLKSANNLSAREIRDIMRESDVAISAGGGTLNELAACGVPTIALLFAENQQTNLQSFESRNAIVKAKDIKSIADVLNGLSFEIRSAISARFFAISQEAKWTQHCEEILRLLA